MTPPRSVSKRSLREPGMKSNPLPDLDPEDAYGILVQLVEREPRLLPKVKKLAAGDLGDVDPKEVAAEVFEDLNALEVEDLWDEAGPTRDDGYVSEDEAARNMLEEALDPHIHEVKKLWKLGLREGAARCMRGVLKGLARFKLTSRTKFQEWAGDEPYTYFRDLLDAWKEVSKGGKPWEDMVEWIGRNVSENFLEYVDHDALG